MKFELDNNEYDETDEMTDTVSFCESTESETEPDELIDSSNKQLSQFESEIQLFSEKMVCLLY